MRNRLWLNLGLVVVVAGLTAVMLLDTGDEDKAKPPITQLSADEISTVELRFPEDDTIRLEKSDSGWRLTAPIEGRAEDSEVKTLLGIVEKEPARTYLVAEMDLGEVGLAPPKQTLVFDDTEIALGDTDPVERKRYARVGDTVYLIDSPTQMAVDADYSDLVARRLVPQDVQMARIQLPDFTLTRQETGGWAVTPDSADRGADAAQKTVNAWERARAMWMKPAGEKAAQGAVVIETEDGTSHRFEIVARKPQLILRSPALGVKYHVSASQAAPMLDMRHDKGEDKPKQRAEQPTGTASGQPAKPPALVPDNGRTQPQ